MASTYTSKVAKHSMDYIFEKGRDYSYRCSGVNSMGATCCKREGKSERLDSFFAQRHLFYDVVMQGIYYWLNRIPRMTMGVMLGVSSETIRYFIANIHQLIQMDLTNNDIRIERIDANSQSIIRDAATFLQVIKKHVKPNSIIHTDCWAAYGGLTSVVDMNYTHRTVNHNVKSVEWNNNELQGQIANKTNGAIDVDGILKEKKYENRLWQGILKTLTEVSFRSIVDNPIFTNYDYLEDDKDEEYSDSTMIVQNVYR
ncbi:hypothetical protein PHYBLDRAFT_140531 [Phycomyces blakesleeanus NRRL 1555(-)]|uniref:Uncharacterized protein n=1 Tax=Phycomyces blakesleeanus (strain ATCC 8743b / DSM 1359 / FGSC 10004 / NBRC 33097 / NRRL 1555) TaxID=763407 RepID=A0A167PSD0_PHYB8|nr:hypothetical protein PHYBLDRAFT_140531 [Phycomyces blakesleeanus NRRL 1555(-)]OAD78454.1 hypothetical protein PHYBLDRAFT_140531 [Phycomyces blakesleeanus NRRL 1555(-)]|eukprot:XP_018296494.1 hypothetical protein PHYBLDRAFT_140531 [Phycomyces blakesleeanus NRRL 1555(-)]